MTLPFELTASEHRWPTLKSDTRSSGPGWTPPPAIVLRSLHKGCGQCPTCGAVHAAGISTVVVTSTERELVEIALDTLGRDLFTATICGDEVTDPKPTPEAYLRVAALIGVDPAHCVAIEDSPTGVAAAEAARCAVLAVPSAIQTVNMTLFAEGRRAAPLPAST